MKRSDEDYFKSDTFKRKAAEISGQGISVTSLDESNRIYRNYLKNSKKSQAKKGK
ncbi:hypothetical protein ACTQ1D_01525 [Parafannyhessea umbonata]|uniref:hypothetical protein n=1 Tax=Parafannyhessea umbonata TaxID=604330 RepID=UPI003F9D798D